jgi:hypothetical protein
MNQTFPEWKIADGVLDSLITNSFKVDYTVDGNDVTFSVLPPAVDGFVHPDYKEKFAVLYIEFINWIQSKGAFNGIDADTYQITDDHAANEPVYRSMLEHIEHNLHEIGTEIEMPVQHVLKGLMGIEPFCYHLPSELEEWISSDEYLKLVGDIQDED